MTADQPKNNKDNLDGIAGLSNLVPVQINLRLIGEHGSKSYLLLKFHRFGAGSEKKTGRCAAPQVNFPSGMHAVLVETLQMKPYDRMHGRWP